jgi:hypothetical protein
VSGGIYHASFCLTLVAQSEIIKSLLLLRRGSLHTFLQKVNLIRSRANFLLESGNLTFKGVDNSIFLRELLLGLFIHFLIIRDLVTFRDGFFGLSFRHIEFIHQGVILNLEIYKFLFSLRELTFKIDYLIFELEVSFLY